MDFESYAGNAAEASGAVDTAEASEAAEAGENRSVEMSHVRLTRQESQAETRKRLLDAAAEVFAEKGVAGASVERIVERAGYTRGAFYGHFPDKDALVAALLEERTRQERDEVAALASEQGDTAEALRAWHRERAEHLEDWLALRLELVRHILRQQPGERPGAAPGGRSVLADREALARGALSQAVAAECGPDVDAGFVALVLHALEDGLAIQRAIAPETVPADAVVGAAELVLRGARTPASTDERKHAKS